MKSWIFFLNWYVLIPFYLSRHDIFSLGQVFKLSQTPIFLGRNFKNFAVSKMHFSVLKHFMIDIKIIEIWKFFLQLNVIMFFFPSKYENITAGTFITIANSFLKVWNFKNFQPQNFCFNPVNMLSQRLKRFLEWKLKFWKVEFFFGTGMF